MTIDFSPLDKTLESLNDILKQPLDEYIKSGIIHRFQNTFELSWKMMQRVLKEQGITTGSPMQTFREAEKSQLISDLNFWIETLKKRNLTVHTYNEDTAEEVYQAVLNFPEKVEKLLTRLKKEVS